MKQGMSVLDAGAGWGNLWRCNQEQILTLPDFLTDGQMSACKSCPCGVQ